MKTIKIPELNIEVQTEISQKGKSFNEIKIPKGWRLLRAEEIIFLFNNYEKELNMTYTWEFFEQPFKKHKDKCCAAFNAASYGADFFCFKELFDTRSSLGVRFAKDIKKRK